MHGLNHSIHRLLANLEFSRHIRLSGNLLGAFSDHNICRRSPRIDWSRFSFCVDRVHLIENIVRIILSFELLKAVQVGSKKLLQALISS